MKLSSAGTFCVAFGCLALSPLFSQTSPNQRTGALKSGTVVEKVAKHSEAEKAGIQEEDILLRWRRGDAKGEIQSPFDLTAIEIEQAPLGTVVLEGLRGTESKSWPLGSNTWGSHVRPSFPQAVLTLYREGQDLAAAGKLSEAAEKWRAIAGQPKSSDLQWLRPWLLFHIAQLQAEARQWKEADQAFQEAVQISAAEPELAAQVGRAWASTYMQRSDWERADEQFRRAIAIDQATGRENFTLALDLDNLGTLARKRGDLPKADDYFQRALRVREKLAPGSLQVALSLNNLGELADDRGDLDKAGDYDRRALTIAEKTAPGSLIVATALGNLGDVAFDRGILAQAKDYYTRSLEIRKEVAPDSLDVGKALNGLGLVAWRSGDLDKAEEYYRHSLAIHENLAPGSMAVAASLGNLGIIARQRGDLAKTEEYYLQSLAIMQKLAPGSMNVARSFNNLGIVASLRGDLAKAEEYHRQSLAIKEKLAPGSLDVGVTLTNLGNVTRSRGNLAKAEEYYRQSLAIHEKFAPGSLTVAAVLNGLGLVAWQRGDLAKAEEDYRKALEIQEKLAPGRMDVAMSLDNLMLIALERDDLAQAEELSQRGFAISQKFAPNSLDVARALSNLGLVARQRGDLSKAADYYQRANQIREKLAPGGVDLALDLNRLGSVLQARGDLDAAEQSYRGALAIWERLAPGSADHADALAGLGSVLRQRSQFDAAAQYYAQALDALEGQTARLGGAADVRAGFRAKHENYYHEYIDLLVSQNKPELAFTVLERSRARMLLETLATAHLDIRKGADPKLVAKERSLQAEIKAKSERRVRLLSDKHTDEQIKAIENEIGNQISEYQDVEAQIRSGSPVFAALTQPQPLRAKEVQQELLDPDTLLLEYSLGEERSYVFAVTQDSLQVFPLPKRSEIEDLAQRIYDLLTAPNRRNKDEDPGQRQQRIAEAQAKYPKAEAQLGQILLGPVAGLLKDKRLLIVSDGALYYVPFAALRVPRPGKLPAPLVSEHEIINLPSASVLSLLRQQQAERKPGAGMVAVLADPVFDKDDARVTAAAVNDQPENAKVTRGDHDLAGQKAEAGQSSPSDDLARAAADIDWERKPSGELFLPRLRYSRQEAEAIAAMTPAGQTLEALDFKASRDLATSPELANYRIVHFATHALFDNKHPELSGLVLSLVDERGKPRNGFLGLEEIYNLDLPVDMVVLSACETGLGKKIEGEGLVGLTRGFMYAGANRIVASLWNVGDRATAELMGSFYRSMLRDGLRPAAALRRAQLQMLKQQRWSSPYFWAAFQIQGEWK